MKNRAGPEMNSTSLRTPSCSVFTFSHPRVRSAGRSESGGSSWISMTNDGKTAFTGDGSIIDVRAHKVIGIMKDEYGRNLHATEKVVYLTVKDGKIIDTSNQFAIGMAGPTQARLDEEKNKRAGGGGG